MRLKTELYLLVLKSVIFQLFSFQWLKYVASEVIAILKLSTIKCSTQGHSKQLFYGKVLYRFPGTKHAINFRHAGEVLAII